jgi:SAM-dependent methyltransferase
MHDPLEERLARAYLAAVGRPELDLAVHPTDEMLGYLEQHETRPGRLATYLRTGREALAVVRGVLARTGRSEPGRMLDFACGCGRSTRWFSDAFGAGAITASDIDPVATAWVGERFGARPLVSATDPDAVELGGLYDLIWVGSLFSHLPPATFGRWLARLWDVLSPGGALLFSTHGPGVLAGVDAGEQGFGYAGASETERLGEDEYGTAVVTEETVRRVASEAGVPHLHRMARDIWDIQDVYVARRADAGELEGHANTPLVRGAIERAEVRDGAHVWVGGFAQVPAAAGPVREVRLVIDGTDTGPAQLGEPTEVPLRSPGGAPWLATPWYNEGDAAWLEPGAHALCALAVDAAGGEHCFDVTALER